MAFCRSRLILLRKRMKITQHKLAWDTLIDTATIFRLESGEFSNPKFDVVEKLADYFKVNMGTFSSKTKEI